MTDKRTPILFLILVSVQLAHSIEEYFSQLHYRFPVVTGEIHRIIPIFPILHMRKTLFAALNVVFIALLLTVCIDLFKGRRWAIRAARIIAIIEIINGLAHLSAAAYTGGYFPGCISAAGLLIIGILLFRLTKGVNIFHRVAP